MTVMKKLLMLTAAWGLIACGPVYLVDDVDPVIRTRDVDLDGIDDRDEIEIFQTNPDRFDTDLDGASDGEEIYDLMTDPLDADTDRDGLFDGEEAYGYGTDPLDWDTDGDGYGDGEEVRTGFDPLRYE